MSGTDILPGLPADHVPPPLTDEEIAAWTALADVYERWSRMLAGGHVEVRAVRIEMRERLFFMRSEIESSIIRKGTR